MLGMVYTVFSDMVEENLGIGEWNKLLADVGSDGIFTSGALYDDLVLVSLIQAYANKMKKSVEDILRAFGIYLFKQLGLAHHDMLKEYSSARELLLSVDKIIHREVEILYPNSKLPTFKYSDTDSDDNKLTMIYISDRQLCYLAEGLIIGAGEYYNIRIKINHSLCCHKGDKNCQLELTFHEK